MPLYEYVCTECTRSFEELVFGDASPACPSCQGHEVERVLSVPAPGRVKEGASAPVGCGACGNPAGPGACRLS